MATTMEYKVLNLEGKKTNDSFVVERLSIQQLIDLAIESNDNTFIETESRQELIRRGNDCIQTRILIKKSCKKTMSSLEALLNKISTENNDKEKGIVKSMKNKFLTSVSIVDKLQLEWQKYDLGLKH